MQNINPYPEKVFQEEFSKTDLYQQLVNDYDIVTFDKHFKYRESWDAFTPRQLFGQRRKTIFSAVAFYYLQFLRDNNPQRIYDLGCGWNIFKKYFPEVIGVGAEYQDGEGFFGDIHDYVDEEYIANHQGEFESVFSINALHFHPIEKFKVIIEDFYSMIKPGGRGFIALNSDKMVYLGKNPPKGADNLEKFFRSELLTLNHIKFLVVDIDLSVMHSSMEGNIRLVMEKPKK